MALPTLCSALAFGGAKILSGNFFGTKTVTDSPQASISIQQSKFSSTNFVQARFSTTSNSRAYVYAEARKTSVPGQINLKKPNKRNENIFVKVPVLDGSIFPTTLNSVEMRQYSVYVPSRNYTYNYLILEHENKFYFSPFGVYGRYENLKYDYQTHILPHAQNIFKQLGVPFCILGQYDVEVDHVLKKPFRDALSLNDKNSYAVIVPAILNAERTNIRLSLEFAMFDFRIKSWNWSTFPSLSNFVKTRLWGSLLWTRDKIYNFTNSKDLLFRCMSPFIENGYGNAMAGELKLIESNFINPNGLKENAESVLAFFNEQLLQARASDLIDFKLHLSEYNSTKQKNIVSKNFAIKQAVAANVYHIQVGEYFINSINSSKYKHNSINRHIYLTENLKQIIEKIIESDKFKPNFKVEEAKQELLKLVNAKKTFLKNKMQKINFNQNKEMEEICNNILRLGDSYLRNGRILDLTLSSAKKLALFERKPTDYYIEKTTMVTEQNIFQVPSALSSEAYKNIANKEDSEFAKQLLKKNFPGNVSEEQFVASLTQARNINKFKQNSEKEDSSSNDLDEFYNPTFEQQQSQNKKASREIPEDLEEAFNRLDLLQKNNFDKKLPNVPKTKISRPN